MTPLGIHAGKMGRGAVACLREKRGEPGFVAGPRLRSAGVLLYSMPTSL